MEWQIVLVLITLVGFVTAIVTPLLKLNTSISNLNATMKNLDELVTEVRKKQESHEANSNKKFSEYEHRLTEHTVKIKNLERQTFK